MFEEYGTHQPEADKLDVWFGPDVFSTESFLRARWLFLRCLGGVFFSAFYSLYFQIHGLIGPNGILPASSYLDLVHRLTGWRCYALVPTLLWINSGELALDLVVWLGLAASVAIMLNLWPRLSILIALLLFLSFVSAAQQFSGYQSDGMLLEAAFLSLFFAPPGLRPGLGAAHPPSRASLFMLRWEWFRIYFESGLVKLLSGETQWRDLSAMDRYYENGPLPSWIGWYVQHWPHGFHAVTCAATLIVELFVVWLVFLPKSSRRIAFLITTPLQIGIILTANYAFLNYLVLILGFLLLDDRVFERVRLRAPVRPKPEDLPPAGEPRVRYPRAAAAGVLITVFFATISSFVVPNVPVLNIPATVLAPFRIANSFGLFAVMTRARYEIEFQGTADGKTWIAYPFRYKPQDPGKAPGIYAPYQPRFEWNLWFASLAPWEENKWVVNAEVRLLENQPAVLQLFAANPFRDKPPLEVRAVLWQYWFTTGEQKLETGAWWNRESHGAFAPAVIQRPDGSIELEEEPRAE